MNRNLYTLNHVTNFNELKNVFLIMSSVSNDDRFKKIYYWKWTVHLYNNTVC